MNDTIKVITDAGTLGVLVAVLGGLFYLAWSVIPSIKDFFVGITTGQKDLATTQKDLATKQAVIDAKVDIVLASMANLNAAMAKAGDVVVAALVKVTEMVQAEGRETREDLTAAEERLALVVRREQPEPPNSKPLRRVQ